MSYCVMPLVPESDDGGWRPAFPPEVGFLLLADTRESRWGLYRYEEPGGEWRSEEPVDDRLGALIASGERYPPALAFARDEVRRRFPTGDPPRVEALEAYAGAVERHLARQWTAPFVLARAVVTEFGYLEAGEWYRVVAVREDGRSVDWVSDDFFVCRNPIEHFALGDGQRRRLS